MDDSGVVLAARENMCVLQEMLGILMSGLAEDLNRIKVLK